MTIYIVLDIGCLECREHTEVRFIGDNEWEAVSYYNNWRPNRTEVLGMGEERMEGRWQFHRFESSERDTKTRRPKTPGV